MPYRYKCPNSECSETFTTQDLEEELSDVNGDSFVYTCYECNFEIDIEIDYDPIFHLPPEVEEEYYNVDSLAK